METLHALFALAFGGTILIVGGEMMVRGATRMASLLRIPPLIIGLTVVSVCTGAPELAVSLTGALAKNGNPDIAVGNILGSNICNILLVLGMAALVRPIHVESRLVKREIPLLILLSVLVGVFGVVSFRNVGGMAEHYFPQWGGFVFLAGLLGYNFWVIRSVGRGEHEQKSREIQTARQRHEAEIQSVLGMIRAMILIGFGVAMLVFGSNRFITGAVEIAGIFGVSQLVISLTVLALGTSLPELTVSLVAAFQGKNDIAIGNVIGSNTFNILGILGLTASLIPGGLTLSPQAFCWDIPMMIGTAIIASWLCITGRVLSRGEGAVLVAAYLGYVAFLFLR